MPADSENSSFEIREDSAAEAMAVMRERGGVSK